tara:strand:+ start:1062 stop:1685 length:624 start_codon:yes stop_codon:yes gene_type:complete
VSEIKIPEITLPTIDIPDTPYFTKPKLEGKLPGCYLYHRDLETTRNPSLLLSDKRGTYTLCPNGEIPSYTPMRYDPAQIVNTEPTPINTASKAAQDANVVQPKPKKDKKVIYKPCPPEGALRVGSYVNEKRLEIIKSYTRNENNECITDYESVTFVDSVLPSPSAALNVVTISLLAASSPLLLGLLKSISKTVFKKVLTKKQDQKNS